MSMKHPILGLPHVTMGGREPLVIVTAVTVGLIGTLWVYWRKSRQVDHSGGVGGRSIRHGVLGFPAQEDPHHAMQVVLDTIRRGKIGTVGELVNFLRGPADETFGGRKHPNAYCIRAPDAFFHFLQESYLPATRDVDLITPDAAAVAISKDRRSSPVVERHLMRQLLSGDMSLRRLAIERGTPFDNHNHHHLNLLQQLWVAIGRPLSTYKRTGAHWQDLGFQGEDPTTDLRGGGVLALRQLVHFAKRHPARIREMMAYNKAIHEDEGVSWYLIAVVSIQFTALLLLECDCRFYIPHLEVLYDTIKLTGQTGKDGMEEGDSSAVVGDSSGEVKLVSRRSLAGSPRYRNTSLRNIYSPDICKLWSSESPSDAEAGLFLLHESLLLLFKECWERDRPHVMSYNTYLESVVFPIFFSKSWTPQAVLGVG
ncbi:unnamed protein product [Phytomonas sp. Hart1]|nr:unnamed protein product [Phytomonas sp. Hart1]|eukprot:CCW70708.1 unnamed protein product [Phytomonas sp. isolate Hart1]